MTDMETIIEKAREKAEWAAMKWSRHYRVKGEPADLDHIRMETVAAYEATLAAEMKAAGKKVVRDCPECAAMIAAGPMNGYDLEYEGGRADNDHCDWWKAVFDNSTCELQAAMKGKGEA